MIGQKLKISRRDAQLICGYSFTKCGGFFLEGYEVARVVGGVLRVKLAELVPNHSGVLDGVPRVGPQMRVGLAFLFGEGEVVNVVGLGQHNCADLDNFGVIFLIVHC